MARLPVEEGATMKLPLKPDDAFEIEQKVGDAAERVFPNILLGIGILAVIAVPVLFIVASCG